MARARKTTEQKQRATTKTTAQTARHEPEQFDTEEREWQRGEEEARRAHDERDARKHELEHRLISAEAKIIELAQLLALLRARQPAAGGEGKSGLWVNLGEEWYQVIRIGDDDDGRGWEVRKWSDGNVYHLEEVTAEKGMAAPAYRCDCQGGQQHGPGCNNGHGCKHARMLRRIRLTVE